VRESHAYFDVVFCDEKLCSQSKNNKGESYAQAAGEAEALVILMWPI